MTRKTTYTTPEGYFEELQQRLRAIPREHPAAAEAPAKPAPLRRFSPYLALAAAITAVVVAGTAVLRHTAAPVLEADTIQLTEDELVDYLIAEGLSIEHIEYIGYDEDNR